MFTAELVALAVVARGQPEAGLRRHLLPETTISARYRQLFN